MEQIIEKIRKQNPLIHHLTNQVVMNFTANGLLSFGAAPIMAKAPEEARDIASIADGVLINIGTLTSQELNSMIIAGKTANERNIPVVLDPVGVAATPFRTAAVKRILDEVHPTVIKGNAGELAHIAGIHWKTKGVESIGSGNTEEIAQKVSEVYDTTAVITDEIDIICTEKELIQNHTGHPILKKVTGAGCLLGSIITACLTTDDNPAEQALAAVKFYGLAAEYAVACKGVNGSGTFIPPFIDSLSFDYESLNGGAGHGTIR